MSLCSPGPSYPRAPGLDSSVKWGSRLESPLAASFFEGAVRCRGHAPSSAEQRCLVSGDKFMASGFQLAAARSLLRGEDWPGGGSGGFRLGTTPCCWWSRGCSGCSRCCGWYCCSQRRPGQPPPPRAPACWGHLRGVGGVEVRVPVRTPPLPQRLH